MAGTRSLADLPNVAVKISSLPKYLFGGLPQKVLAREVVAVLEAFGPARTFWGSDLTALAGSYQETLDFYRELLSAVDPRQRSQVLGEAVCAWFGWPR